MKLIKLSIAVVTFIAILFNAEFASSQNFASVSGIKSINLVGVDGKAGKISLSKPVVLIFLSPECPLCKNYLPGLVKLQNSNKQITFYGIVPGNSYSLKEIKALKADYQINFELLSDRDKKISKYLKATTTPEVFLINKTGAITYKGMIDNWPTSLGKTRLVVTQKYLEDAISDLLKGKISYKETTPIGCLINDI